ncbi:MAG: ATP-binding protein [Anaerovoracaceae bacterium]
MFRSIQTKTMFFMASLAICLIVIIGYMTVFAMDYAIDEIKENDMRDKAIMAANVVSRELGRNSQPTAEILAALDKDSLNGDIFLINSRGYSIGNSDTEKPYDFGISGKCSVQEIYKNNKYYVSALAPVKGTNWYVCAEETKSGYMQTITNIKTIIIAAIVIIIFILWPLSKRISFAIQHPIKMLAEDAERIAEGDISREISVAEDNELADIADSFNLMLNKLKNTMQQVLDKSGEAVSMQEIMTYVDETYNNLPTGIISINNIGEITTFNSTAEELTGIRAEEIIGINTSNPTPPQIKKLISELKRCLSRGSLQLKTITDIRDLSGARIPVEYSINIQFGLRNEVLGVICLFRKIEDIRSFEESANRVKTMEALGEIAASMAHEIKNPLTSIRGNTQYLDMVLQEKDLHFDEVDIIMHETDRLTTMLNRFLTYARPRLPETEKLHIEEIMDYVAQLVSREMDDRIIIRREFGRTPPVMIDRKMFESLFINLMLNAQQAMPDGGSIRLKTEFDRNRNMVCASVRDSGKGIPSDISGKIFDPFFTTKDTGTGMGLAIALRTVEAHKGMIEVESIEGEMTQFTIMLQALPEEEDDE